jgi:hypothetical protein
MKMLIKVTKDVLRNTCLCKSNPSENCAIAYAIVRVSYIEFYEDTSISALPIEAGTFILIFDELSCSPKDRMEMPEIQFEIDVPNSVIERIGLSQIYKVLSESKTLEHVNP